MKKLLILLILPCLMLVTSKAQNNHNQDDPVKVEDAKPVPKPLPVEKPEPPNPNAPEFKFEKEVHNFGEVPEGPKAVYEFAFENVGKEPLIIKNARASCGCTVPQWPREPILPGQKDKITVSYNTNGRRGPINKTVTITSNAKTPTTYLKIKGTVKPKPPGATGNPVKSPSILETPKD